MSSCYAADDANFDIANMPPPPRYWYRHASRPLSPPRHAACFFTNVTERLMLRFTPDARCFNINTSLFFSPSLFSRRRVWYFFTLRYLMPPRLPTEQSATPIYAFWRRALPAAGLFFLLWDDAPSPLAYVAAAILAMLSYAIRSTYAAMLSLIRELRCWGKRRAMPEELARQMPRCYIDAMSIRLLLRHSVITPSVDDKMRDGRCWACDRAPSAMPRHVVLR